MTSYIILSLIKLYLLMMDPCVCVLGLGGEPK